ncbi:hypothetical protein BBP00_00008660 [Phytophthora kernoviae]|uniref:Heme haloperoxidase family profile domain-containing protein n=1 Tax=Phytophthora kernoviae TaxID=325452 RepID=A0A3F2RER8_9STRA|nr:hypothetical protein BBP00_00008660 [Phytophthora kernoviae]
MFFYRYYTVTLRNIEKRDRGSTESKYPEFHKICLRYWAGRERESAYDPEFIQNAGNMVNEMVKLMEINALNMIALHFRRRLHQYIRFRLAPEKDDGGIPTGKTVKVWTKWGDPSQLCPLPSQAVRYVGVEGEGRGQAPEDEGSEAVLAVTTFQAAYVKLNASTLHGLLTRFIELPEVENFLKKELNIVRARKRTGSQLPFDKKTFQKNRGEVIRKVLDVEQFETRNRKFADEIKTNGFDASITMIRPVTTTSVVVVKKKSSKKKRKKNDGTAELVSKEKKCLQFFWKHLRFLLAFSAEQAFLRWRFTQDHAKMKALDTLEERLVPKASKQVCIAYGDWNRRTGIKGHASGPVKGFVEALKRRATVIPMDEYRTSITCSCCHQRLKQARLFTKMKRKEDEVGIRQKERLSMKEVKEIVEMTRFRNLKLADKKVVLKCTRNVLRCTNSGCKTNFWNRDVNAARNMLELLKSGLKGKHGARRLRAFRRGVLMGESSSLWTVAVPAATAACVLVYFLLPDERERAIRRLPAPSSTLPLLGNTLDLMSLELPRLHDWIVEQCKAFGGRTWRLRVIGAPPLVVVSSVECFEDVLKTQFEVFDKGDRMNDIFRDMAGGGIGAVDGKKLSQAARSGDPIDFADTMHRFAFDVFTDISFGLQANALEGGQHTDFMEALGRLIHHVEMRFHSPDWLWKLKRALKIGGEKELAEAVEILDKTVFMIINKNMERKFNPDAAANEWSARPPRTTKDVVSLFLDAHDEQRASGEDDGEAPLDANFLRDIAVVVLLAGKDTTAWSMSWLIIMLNRNPKVETKLRQELREKLPKLFSDPNYVPTMDDVENLVYLEAVLRENLRLNPLVPLNAKEANRDTTLVDGTFIKKGTRVYIPSYTLGRMKSVWGRDASKFKPERWLVQDPWTGEQTIRPVSAFQFVSFHAGPRTCLGMRFAMLEMKTAMAFMLSKYHFTTKENPKSYTPIFSVDDSVLPSASQSLTTGGHEYFRPSDDQVWGLPGNSSFKFFRSPCPALNTMANHGHIPRDGKALTPEILGDALMKVYNIDKKVLNIVFQALPPKFTLADLGDPNFIDHDASLVHVDSYFQMDPFKANETLINELLASADEAKGVITTRTMARFRRRREAESSRDNPEFSMSALASFVANGEAAFVVLGLGDSTTATISVEHARSFMLEERIPVDFQRSKAPVSVSKMLFTIAQLKFLAWLD